MHECVTVTSLADFKAEERGEIVLIVDGERNRENPLLDLSIEDHIKHYLDLGIDKKEVVKMVASERGLAKNDVYQIAINIK